MGSEYKLSYSAPEIDKKLGAVDKKAEALEISLEDYNALSEEEKNNGTLYFIPNAVEVGTDMIIDETPTEGSDNLVTSGGVYDKLDELNSDLTSLLYVGTVKMDNISISKDDYYTTASVSAKKDGYKALGVIGHHIEPATNNGGGYTYATLNRLMLYSSQVVGVTLGNSQYGVIDINAQITVYVLYMKII